MSDWQERITHETAPAIRAEHELRYRLAAPLILAADAWVDLGCGNGVAAAAALGDARPPAAVLVDLDRQAVARAAQELAMPGATQLAGDLSDPGDLRRISDALGALDGRSIVTCFEVLEHLPSFVPLIDWAGGLARAHGTTFLISVPNDAFWSIQNPHHLTAWGEGAFEELRRLLPDEHTLLRQVGLAGSAFAPWDGADERHELAVETGGAGLVGTHFIAAFGPMHEQIARPALLVQAEMLEQRRWERQRESNFALMQDAVARLDRTILEQSEELSKRNTWFEEWRSYIHQLEGELGRPLAGVSPDELPQKTEPPPERAADPQATPPPEGGGPPA